MLRRSARNNSSAAAAAGTKPTSPVASSPRRATATKMTNAAKVKAAEEKLAPAQSTAKQIEEEPRTDAPLKAKSVRGKRAKAEEPTTDTAPPAKRRKPGAAAGKAKKEEEESGADAPDGIVKEETVDASGSPSTTAAVKADPAASPKKRAKKEPAPAEDPSTIVRLRKRARDRGAAAVTPTHYVGAHLSAAGGPQHAVLNALRIGAEAFALFVRPKMQWASKPLAPEDVKLFRRWCDEHGYSAGSRGRVVAHGCYLINLGNPDPEKLEKAMGAFIDDVQRCHELGIRLYNFHPGSTVGQCTKEEGCLQIAACINKALAQVPEVTILLENMAGTGNVIGGKFEELRLIMDHVTDKTRIGVCIDTAHAFAAGYDLRSASAYEATMRALDASVGLSNVRAMHLNDSKADLGTQRDRHESIGAGQIGVEAFWRIMNDARLAGIPCVHEVPGASDAQTTLETDSAEVELLYMLPGLEEGDKEGWARVREQVAKIQRLKMESKARADSKAKAKPKQKKKPAAAASGSKKKGGKKAKKEEFDEEEEEEEDSVLSEED